MPHIYGQTTDDLWFGAGFVAAEDRSLLLQLGRSAARAAVADIPGIDAFALVTSGQTFVPSAQSEALVTAQQQKLVNTFGRKGRQILRDLGAYADGVNAYFEQSGSAAEPWTVNDCLAVVAFIGSIFGNGGGAEVSNSDFLARLRAQLGAKRGGKAFVDLMEADDPDAPTTIRRRFDYGHSSGHPTPGSLLVDPGSVVSLDVTQTRQLASNFLVGEPPALGHARVALRRGAAARLLLSRDRDGGRPARSRHPRAGRARARRRSLRPDRPHARLRLEPHVGVERQPRLLPRAALRARRLAAHTRVAVLPLPGTLHRDDGLHRRHARRRSRSSSP